MNIAQTITKAAEILLFPSFYGTFRSVEVLWMEIGELNSLVTLFRREAKFNFRFT